MYSDADILLLDDIFSSIDSETANRINRECLHSVSSRDKIFLLTTNKLDLVQKNDLILRLDENVDVPNRTEREFNENLSQNIEDNGENSTRFKSFFQRSSIIEPKQIASNSSNVFQDNFDFLRNGSFGFGSIYLVLFTSIVSQISSIVCDHWLTRFDSMYGTDQQERFMQIYTAIILTSLMFAILRSKTFYLLCHQSSEIFHNKMSRLLFQSTQSNRIPFGILLSQFSKDIGILDENLPSILFELNLSIGQVSTVIIIIMVFLNRFMALTTLIYIVLMVLILCCFIRTFQKIRLIELKGTREFRNSI